MNEIPQIPQDSENTNDSRGAYKEHLKEPFLEAFRMTGTIYEAAMAVGLNRDTVSDWRKSDPKFANDFMMANLDLTERLESTAINRAVNGIERRVFYKGAPVAYEKEVSDSLLIFLLKSRAPEKYRDVHVDNVTKRESLISSISSDIGGVLRRTIPDHCPSCREPLQFKITVAQELAKLSDELSCQQ